MNGWNIPGWLEDEVKERDAVCVYCGVPMVKKPTPGGGRKTVGTWEHIINDARIITPENIARCCVACNSSKGTRKLADWLQSDYCKRHNINRDTVAKIVRDALAISV